MKTEPEEMKKPEMFIFASADSFGGGGQALMAVLYLVYLTNVLGINPAWAGMGVMVSKIWDAVSDPLMGVISDNTRSSLGRRKPYLLAAGIMLIPAMGILWFPVSFSSLTARVVFVTATYILYCTVTTIIFVPYNSLSTEISVDFKIRNQANMIRVVFSLGATALCTLLPSALFSLYNRGNISLWTFYAVIVFGFGTAFALPQILTGLFVRERVPHEKKKVLFSPAIFFKPLKVRSFRRLLILYISQKINMDIISTVIIYYSLYVVPGINFTIFLGAFLGVPIILFPVFSRLVNRTSKTKIYRLGLPLSIAGAACIAVYPPAAPHIGVYILAGLTALGFAGAMTMSWIMFPDVVDLGELSLGQRIAGSFSGLMTLVCKTSAAAAIFLVGIVLSSTGFVPSTGGSAAGTTVQPGATVLALRLIILLSFALLMGGAWFTARRFRLSPDLAKRVKYFLEKRRNQIPLEEKEQAEYDLMVKEFG
jgi:GPH family glycoside/pentoside/hexuronide:cation symporter/oligogalacturonide transporter